MLTETRVNHDSVMLFVACLIDISFVIYWIVVAIDIVPEQYMFRDYKSDVMQSWNWSFLPLDLLISFTGILAAVLWRQNRASWIVFITISLSLMFCAGLQAIAFWVLVGDFDPTWWGMNLVLMIVPCIFLPNLLRKLATTIP